MYIPNTPWTWSFLIITILQAGVVIALESRTFAIFIENLQDASFDENVLAPQNVIPGTPNPPRFLYTRTIPTFFTLYVFGMVYQLILVWDALRLKNTIQIIGLCILNLLLMVYGAVQIQQIKLAISQLKQTLVNPNVWADLRGSMIAIPIIFAGGTVIISFIAWKLYDEFAWTIYKEISADLRMKRRYLAYQIYIALLKFDFFFFLGFTIQFLVIVQGTYRNDAEFGLTVAAIPITIGILLFAAFCIRHELMVGMIFVIVVYFGGFAYFVFKLVRIWARSAKQEQYQVAAKTLTTFAVICILLIIFTIGIAIKCTTNFNKGLTRHISTTRKPRGGNTGAVDDEKMYAAEMLSPNAINHTGTGGPQPSRMTIE